MALVVVDVRFRLYRTKKPEFLQSVSRGFNGRWKANRSLGPGTGAGMVAIRLRSVMRGTDPRSRQQSGNMIQAFTEN